MSESAEPPKTAADPAPAAESDTAKRYCPNCGAEAKADAAFCTRCGSSLTHAGLYAPSPSTSPYPAPHPPQWQSPFPPLAPTNGLAIASLILGCVWLWWLGSIAAVVCGHIALRQIKRAEGRERGRGLAIAGIVLGYLGVLTLIGFILLIVFSHSSPSSPFAPPTDHT